MTVRRLAPVALLALFVTAAFAQTGAPETAQVVEDADGDAPVGFVDITGVVLNDTGPSLNVTLLLNATPPSPGLQTCGPDPACTYAGPDLRFHVRFRLSDGDNATLGPAEGAAGTYHLLAWFNNTDSPWQFLLLHQDPEGGTTLDLEVPFNTSEQGITWSLPLGPDTLPVPAADRIEPYRITQVWAATEAFLCFSAAGCVPVGEPDEPEPFSVLPLDRAPDNGTGQDYTFPYEEPEPEPEPTPEPTPDPLPEPTPEPTPDPLPEPTQNRRAAPHPTPDPTPATERGLPASGVLGGVLVLLGAGAWLRRQS